MENFFIDDKFYSSLDELIEELQENYEIEDISELPDDYSEKAESSNLEPISEGMTYDYLIDTVFDYISDRMPEDYTEDFEARVSKAIKDSIDIEKMHSLMPKLCYGNGTFFTITKKDLI